MPFIRVPRVLFDWFTLPRALAVIALVGGGYALFVWSVYRHANALSVFGVLALAPIVAVLVAPALVALFPEYIGWVDARTWEPWQGRYYAFDDHQIRVVEARGRLWFVSRDVHAALRLEPRPGALRSLSAAQRLRDGAFDDLLSSEGLATLFGRSTDRRVLRLVAWAEGDVRRPWQNRRDGLMVVAANVDGAKHSPPTGVVTDRAQS